MEGVNWLINPPFFFGTPASMGIALVAPLPIRSASLVRKLLLKRLFSFGLLNGSSP